MRIYAIALEMVRSIIRLARIVREHDPDLARQMVTAATSVPLNMQEGLYSLGGNRNARFHNSMGSARETMSCLHVCVCCEYLKQAEVDTDLDRLDHIIGGLWNLSRKKSPR